MALAIANMYKLPVGRDEQVRVNKVACAVLKNHRVAGNIAIMGYSPSCTGARCCMCTYHGRPGEAAEFGCAVPRVRKVAVILDLIARNQRLPNKLGNKVAFVRDVAASDVAPLVNDVLIAANNAVGENTITTVAAVTPAVTPAVTADAVAPVAPVAPVTPVATRRRRITSKLTRNSCWRLFFKRAEVGTCFCCDSEIERDDGESWNAAHIIAIGDDGEDTMYNIVPACKPCNDRMGTQNLKNYSLDNYPGLHHNHNRHGDYPHLPSHIRVHHESAIVNEANIVAALSGLAVV